MRISYDSEVDALYIRFLETTVTTHHVAEGIALDYAADGRIAGIEILDAPQTLRAIRKCFDVSCWRTWRWRDPLRPPGRNSRGKANPLAITVSCNIQFLTLPHPRLLSPKGAGGE